MGDFSGAWTIDASLGPYIGQVPGQKYDKKHIPHGIARANIELVASCRQRGEHCEFA